MARKMLDSLLGNDLSQDAGTRDARVLSTKENEVTPLGSFGAVGALRRNLQLKVPSTQPGQSHPSNEPVRDVDPDLIDGSFVSDRIGADDLGYAALKLSIEEKGQQSPVLLRPNTERLGRYQVAFGHRRVQVARDLRRPVKAFIRDLTDEELVVLQGQENSARENLSMIERASFAAALDDRGFSRELIITALSLDRTEVGRLLSIWRAIGPEVIMAIGRAPKIGRPRWQMLAEKLQSGRETASRFVRSNEFLGKNSDDRFEALLRALQPLSEKPSIKWVQDEGQRLASIRRTRDQVQVIIPKIEAGEDLQDFLAERLRDLLREFADRQKASRSTIQKTA